MGEEKLEILVESGKKKVKILGDKYGLQILIMKNEFQWTGAPIDEEIIQLLQEAIHKYKKIKDFG